MNTISQQADIQPTLKRIVEIAQTATVFCHNPHGINDPNFASVMCKDCKKPMSLPAGRIQDPALQPLLDVLTEEQCGWPMEVYGATEHPKTCDCKGTGYVLRNWEGLPEWALVGCYVGAFGKMQEFDTEARLLDAFDVANPLEYAHGIVLSWLEEYVKEKAPLS